MEQYISKSVLVAEIEKCYNECLKRAKIIEPDYWNAKADAYRNVLVILTDIIDTKEMEEEPVSNDLEAEFDNYTKDILACDIQFEPFTHLHNCARHFFELGLKAKGEQKYGKNKSG